jgi:hypothetical protein
MTPELAETYRNEIAQCDAAGHSLYVEIARDRLLSGKSFTFATLNHLRSDVLEVSDRTTDLRHLAIFASLTDQHICQRCSGVGGADCWPGWVCFDCGGRGLMPGSGK